MGVKFKQKVSSGFCHCGCGGRTKLAPHTSKALGRIKGQPMKYIVGHNSKRSPINDPSTDPIEIGWAAGFYEGEGCIHVDKRGNGSIYLQVRQNDPWALHVFCEIVGTGGVKGPYKPPKNGISVGEYWAYKCGGYDRCKQVTDLIYPYLSVRRQSQIDRAYSALERERS